MHAFIVFAQRLDKLPIYTACSTLFLLMLLTFCDVLMRSLFNAPIEAATELTRIGMAVLVFSVLPHISVNQQHICVDLTDALFKRAGLSRLRDGVVFIACAAMLIWPIQRVVVLAERARDYGDVTEYIGLPQYYLVWFIALSLSLTALSLLLAGVLTLLGPQSRQGASA